MAVESVGTIRARNWADQLYAAIPVEVDGQSEFGQFGWLKGETEIGEELSHVVTTFLPDRSSRQTVSTSMITGV